MQIIEATWPDQEGSSGSNTSQVRAFCTTRLADTAIQPAADSEYESFNMGLHVGDDPQKVLNNRQKLMQYCQLESSQWLNQVHSTICVQAGTQDDVPTADACWTDQKNLACIVMTADCLPVVFRQGDKMAAAHAGWRGLAGGVLENTLQVFDSSQTDVWLGPAIGPQAFEVGSEVREQFIEQNPLTSRAFIASANPGKWLADIYALARIRLQVAGIDQSKIYGGDYCTYTQSDRFYSYRRHSPTGRMATVIYRT